MKQSKHTKKPPPIIIKEIYAFNPETKLELPLLLEQFSAGFRFSKNKDQNENL